MAYQTTDGVWFGTKFLDDSCSQVQCGPFDTEAEALDWESNGAYAEWLAHKADERRDESYRDQMRDAGRGHLLGWDD